MNAFPSTARCVGMGGTFDHFHDGHRAFLRAASQLGERLMVGVTVPELTQHKVLAQLIEPFETRQTAVREFLRELNCPAEVFPLTDEFGPTIKPSPVDALAVTELTQRGATHINQRRQENGFSELPVTVVPLLRDDAGEVLSSTAVRLGKVNRQGQHYARIWQAARELSEVQRDFFHQLQGRVVTKPSPGTMTVVVGDIVLETFRKNAWPYAIGVYDRRSQRVDAIRANLADITPTASAINPAGSLTPAAGQALETMIANGLKKMHNIAPEHLLIDGEEDLLTVAAVLLLPLHSHVYYGHRDYGMVELITTEREKENFFRVMSAARDALLPEKSQN